MKTPLFDYSHATRLGQTNSVKFPEKGRTLPNRRRDQDRDFQLSWRTKGAAITQRTITSSLGLVAIKNSPSECTFIYQNETLNRSIAALGNGPQQFLWCVR